MKFLQCFGRLNLMKLMSVAEEPKYSWNIIQVAGFICNTVPQQALRSLCSDLLLKDSFPLVIIFKIRKFEEV